MQHLLKNHARNAAGQVDEIVVLRHFGGKGRIGQKAAVLDLVAGKGALKGGGVVFVQVGVHIHGAVRQNRLRRAGVEQVQHDLVEFEFHSLQSSLKMAINFIIPRFGRFG